jgi:formate dehydrogenase major subunit
MIQITIDDKKIEVPEGTTVLQAARLAGVEIPTLCDHPSLTPYGGCRLCLVEVEGARTLQPSCTLPASNNAVVRTNTDKVKDARKFVLTLIFSERNHFCMYCQVSGGDCELQNSAYREGMTHWPLSPNYQGYPVDASNPYFVMDHNRCILCRRCVRACGELVGNFTLGFEERGAKSVLVADFGVPLGQSTCVSCGACVQICPTGALIDRDSAYRGREKQVDHTKTICTGCSVGCGLEVLARENRLVRIDGDWDAEVNEGILCKTGRFLPMADSRERIVTPLLRKNGSLKAATWDEALGVLSSKLGAGSSAALISAGLPLEALTAFQQLFGEKLHSAQVTSTLDGAHTQAAMTAAKEHGAFEGQLSALKKADWVCLVGADLAADHEVAGFFVKRRLPAGMNLVVIASEDQPLFAQAQVVLKVQKDTEGAAVSALAAALESADHGSIQAAAEKCGVSAEAIRKAAALLGAAKQPVFVYGSKLSPKGAAQTVKSIAAAAAKAHASVLSPKGQANGLAAAVLGLDTPFAPAGVQSAFVALGDEEPSQRLVKALEGVPFVAVLASCVSAVTARADVVLPAETWAEQAGTFINLEGRVQSANRVLQPAEGVRTSADVICQLAAQMGLAVEAQGKEALAGKPSMTALA